MNCLNPHIIFATFLAVASLSPCECGESGAIINIPPIGTGGVVLGQSMLFPGGHVTAVVKDIFNRFGLPVGNGQNDELGTLTHLREIWSTVYHYLGRYDLSPTEILEDIGLDILNGFSEKEKETVYFYLYNKRRDGPDVIKYGSLDKLVKSSFAKGKPVKFLIHGYRMNGFSHFNYLLKNAYLKRSNEVNVVNVDWRRLAGDQYFVSTINTRIVGERIGELVVFLKRNGFINSYKDVHLVGFSLGAHVAGYAGKYLIKTEKQQIGRITGLDPAGPSFGGLTPYSRLDKEDAAFVDVIHTSLGRSGIVESIGHVDFFPNGGLDQPGCEWDKISDFFLRNCSHERAFYLYLATIKGRKFLGCPCKSLERFEDGECSNCTVNSPEAEYMGEFCNSTARGNKYLTIKGTYSPSPR